MPTSSRILDGLGGEVHSAYMANLPIRTFPSVHHPIEIGIDMYPIVSILSIAREEWIEEPDQPKGRGGIESGIRVMLDYRCSLVFESEAVRARSEEGRG